MAVLDREQFNEEAAEQLRKFAPVRCGEKFIGTLAEAVDVLIVWGIAHPQDYLFPSGNKPKVIFVSHGCAKSRWTCSVINAANEGGIVDYFVGVSGQACEPIRLAGRRPLLIANGVDFARIAGRKLEHTGKILGYVGRLSTEKRPEVFVETIAALPARWRGLMIGKDYLDGRTQDLARIIANGRITFPGWTEYMGNALNWIDALLVPSVSEGYGYQIAEAWARGIPVVSTPVGLAAEHPELVRTLPELPTGIQAARAVLADETDPQGTYDRAAAALVTVHERYSAERMGKQWSDFLWSIGTSYETSARPAAIDAR